MDALDSSNTIKLLNAGGVEELTKLFMQHRAKLREMIASRIHGRLGPRFDASDIVQEAFMRANRSLSNYLKSPQIHPTIWLRLICKQLLAENIRQHFRQKRSPDYEVLNVDDDKVIHELADSLQPASELVAKKEQAEQVRNVLAKLNETDRELIEMRHTDGYSFRYIAELLELNMETAKKRYYRAIEKFRNTYDRHTKK